MASPAFEVGRYVMKDFNETEIVPFLIFLSTALRKRKFSLVEQLKKLYDVAERLIQKDCVLLLAKR
jgi:hypothetical protein